MFLYTVESTSIQQIRTVVIVNAGNFLIIDGLPILSEELDAPDILDVRSFSTIDVADDFFGHFLDYDLWLLRQLGF